MDLIEIARLDEHRQAEAFAGVAPDHIRVAGGVAARSLPGSWLNAAVGLGMSGPVDGAEIDRVIDFYASRGIEPRIEVCPFADASLVRAMEERGFTLRLFEGVFYRELDAPVLPVHPRPAGLAVSVIDHTDEAGLMEYVRVTTTGFMDPGVEPDERFLAPTEAVARHRRHYSFLARIDGRAAGGGGVEIGGPIGLLFGMSVLPEFRGRGIQQAVIADRLNFARERGVRVVTIGSRPGVATERNVVRMGFKVLYTKPIMCLRRPGLTRVG